MKKKQHVIIYSHTQNNKSSEPISRQQQMNYWQKATFIDLIWRRNKADGWLNQEKGERRNTMGKLKHTHTHMLSQSLTELLMSESTGNFPRDVLCLL